LGSDEKGKLLMEEMFELRLVRSEVLRRGFVEELKS
jgi:hypothetical protein